MELPVRIDLFAVSLLQTEHNLHGREVVFVVIGIRGDQLLFRGNHDLRSDFKDVHDLN